MVPLGSKSEPSGAKAPIFMGLSGTTEVVPFHKTPPQWNDRVTSLSKLKIQNART
jgi:hypothetical protein